MSYFDRKNAASIFLIIMLSALSLAACGYNGTSKTVVLTNTADSDSENTVISVMNQKGIYDSEDAAVVVGKDTEAHTVQFQNISSSRRYTLNYDGTTQIYDRNDQSLSMEQLKEGSIVTVRFYKPTKALAYVKENPECINYSNVSSYDMDLTKGTIQIGKDTYNISGHVVVISDGRETDMMEVNQVDVISVWGYKNMIYGINVESGHGYLRLQNEDYFLGGWLDVGDKVIRKITEDMILVVPEGTYSVSVSNKGSSATQTITFNRNEEMAWNLGDVEITIPQTGSIIFTLTPVTSKVYIDGREVDVSKPVTLEYGLHQMRITADGYESVAQYIKVAEPSANISVELEKSQEETETETESESEKSSDTVKSTSEKSTTEKSSEETESSSASNETTNSNTSSTTKKYQTSVSDDDELSSDDVVSASSKYKVYIDAPEGVEAYLDGNYVGITPVSFAKKAGSYVITLRKTGYQTRSYTLQVDSEEKDVNYTFTELIKVEE
jgi:hypothetical protein